MRTNGFFASPADHIYPKGVLASQIVYDGVHYVPLDPEISLELLVSKPRNSTNPVTQYGHLSSLMVVLNVNCALFCTTFFALL
jgi:hypothetical protein